LGGIPLHSHVPTSFQLFGFECWTTTAALARDTKRIRLSQEGTCQGYRNPALLAKMASTVDVLSHGRLTLGIAAGEYEGAFQAFGYEMAGSAEALEEASSKSSDGIHYQAFF
jgi:alkanesulfonate monooxygenase SsuD/methylene tetrahydromethanopterin reductase-like flavin-dependent oxidoreductase (luciferase family)